MKSNRLEELTQNYEALINRKNEAKIRRDLS